MTSTSVELIADVLRAPRRGDSLHWVTYDPPFRTAQDYAAAEYLYRLRLCTLRLRSSLLPPSAGPPPLHYPVQVTAQLVYMDEPLSPVVESAAVYAAATVPLPEARDEVELTYTFAEEWLIFPLELCDVPLDTCCVLHLWHGDVRVAGTSFHVYSIPGELCVGQQSLVLARPCADSLESPLQQQQQQQGPQPVASAHTAQLLADHHRGMMPYIPWLDALSVHQLELAQARCAAAAVRHGDGSGSSGAPLAVLLVYLPGATTAVFFEPAVARVGDEVPRLVQPSEGLGIGSNSSSSAAAAAWAPPNPCDFTQRPFPDQYTYFKEHNLCEAKAAITAKSQYFMSDSSVPPGPRERHQLASLLRRPPIQLDSGPGAVAGAGGGGVGAGRLEETRLLWKYRHFVCRDGKYFLPFMRSVDWANTHSSERRAACALLHQWAAPSFADVLACLSFYFGHVAPVRQYAVRLLRRESDARVCQLAFQLLQAVRYDSPEAELAEFLLERAVGCWELCSTLYTLLAAEVALERRRTAVAAAKAGPTGTSNRNGGNAAVGAGGGGGGGGSSANSGEPPVLFEPLLRRLAERVAQHCPHFILRLRRQHALHRVLQQLSRQVQQSLLDRLSKTALGNKLIAKQACGLHALFSTPPRRPGSTGRHADGSSFTSSSGAAVTAAAVREEPLMSPARTEEGSDPDTSVATAAAGAAEDGEDVTGDASAEQSHASLSPFPPASAASAPHAAAVSHHQSRRAPVVDVLDRYGVATLATHPGIPITGLQSNSLYIFKSAKLPMRLTFNAMKPAATTPEALGQVAAVSPCLLTPLAMQPAASHRGARGATSASAAAAAAPSPSAAAAAASAEEEVGGFLGVLEAEETVPLAMMYKYDDDVRQDQLIAQLIGLMDNLLQQDGLQLYLTPYRVIATGPQEGLVEIVPHVTTFLSVQRDVLKYLRVYNPTAELLRLAMDRYTRSFAGYCVITFVLGIGDRHLENILLTQDGRLLHIDFGYVLGNDPKPFPPPMKINREMVEVLGGPQSTGFTEFKLFCCSAYNTLRKHAPLLLHLLLLGAHAEGIPQVTGEGGDPRVNLLKVQEKLRLDLTNAQATQYLQNVIADSVGSIFTNLWDVLHAAAQATRS